MDTPASDAEITRLKRLFERNPTSTIFARLADAYLSLGQTDTAISVCKLGLKYRPSYVTGHIVLGRAFIETDALAVAEDEFQKVLRLEPHHLAALQLLALVADRLGDHDRSDCIWKQLRVLNPFQHAPASGEVAEAPVVHIQSDGPDQAQVFGASLDHVPSVVEDEDSEFPFVSLTLARMYARQGHRGLAERVARLVSPGDAEDILDRNSQKSSGEN